ncbi:glycoside hydrolase family 3 C-terminal domain-containing protein [Microlunatus speluncae]|uniref:glycoside hydrolase family 3 C-terminal domain-containing protein n=1 Tax=Microlunatus speluncae TaxID=2594267 RepID=UPI0012660C46|nr:glycoside hydrolase family 3 C-terminal domain-containing protein [Microlunatus speluncae]
MVADPVAALLAELSVEEKLALLHQAVPALPRHGLAAFHTGAEAAHGVAWEGLATVFPQPVGMAASWDRDLLRRVGAVVGIELRAKRAANPDIGLNAWAPVVNPLRHPRWGRNEEGFSEDPWLTAELAGAYAAGMRGDDDHRWRVVPTLKHFCGYNNETDRDVSDSQLRRRVLHEYELPAYRGPVVAGAVGAVMASYNLINGRPAHVSADLLDELRSWTDDSLLVVSDAFAPRNLAGSQAYFEDHPTSHAAALRAGMDSFTDNGRDPGPTLERLRAALRDGLIGLDDVDRSVERVLRLREKLGELDDHDPYAGIGPDELDRPEHRELAREAVAAGVVVLRNDGLLPLPPQGKLAVVGPFAERVLTDWYSGTPPYTVSLAAALSEAAGPGGEVRVVEGSDRIALQPVGSSGFLRNVAGRLTADGLLASGGRPEPAAIFAVTDWGHGLLTLTADDGRLWTIPDGRWVRAEADRVGGWVVQESFRLHRHDDGSWSLRHQGTGKWLRVDVAGGLSAECRDLADATRFLITVISDGRAEVAAAAAWADTVIMTAGNDPHLLGRETEDRPDLALPEPQAALLRAARAATDRVLLIIVSSYPYALDASIASTPAIVWTSHAGQELGHGVVDVITGAVEPAGRLAQAWPAPDNRLPDLFDYDIISSRGTYWYSDQAPLYSFGHGLGYAPVDYADLTVAAAAGPVRVSVRVTNAGDRPVVEVVQAYVSAPAHRLQFPRRLCGWQRVRLEPGESRIVDLELHPGAFETYDVTRSELIIERGDYVIGVGTNADDHRCVETVRLAGETVGPHDLTGPVEAAAFDHCTRIRLAPRESLRGEVVAAEDGVIVFAAVDLGLHDQLELRIRRAGRIDGRVEVTLDGRSLGSVPATEHWRPATLPAGRDPVRGELRLRLVQAAVDTIRAVGAS